MANRDVGESAPRWAGERWTDAENAQLVELLRTGLGMEDIAARLGRGIDAVGARCQLLLPPDGVRVRRSEADQVLRAELVDPAYDWREGLRAEAARRGSFYWDPTSEATLRAGWRNRTPLAELVESTGASEIEVAQRLVALDLATSSVEVAQRLGCDPGATLDVRVRVAADRAAAAVTVLVVDGARGSERAKGLDRDDALKAYRHVSIHATIETAEQELVRLLVEHRYRGGAFDEVSVTSPSAPWASSRPAPPTTNTPPPCAYSTRPDTNWSATTPPDTRRHQKKDDSSDDRRHHDL